MTKITKKSPRRSWARNHMGNPGYDQTFGIRPGHFSPGGFR